MKRGTKQIMMIIMIVTGLLGLVACSEQTTIDLPKEKTTLFAYVGAGLKEPFEELVTLYQAQSDVELETTYNHSGGLVTQLDTSKKGDIFMPGGMPFVKMAEEKGHIDHVDGPIAYHTPVIVTPKGNPARVTKLEDLAKEGTELIVPELEATALGKTANKVFEKAGLAKEIKSRIITSVDTGPKVTATLLLGKGNAAITEYSSWYNQQDKLDLIEIDPSQNIVDEIPCAVTKYATNKEEADKFAHFVAEKGPEVFEKYGFKVKP